MSVFKLLASLAATLLVGLITFLALYAGCVLWGFFGAWTLAPVVAFCVMWAFIHSRMPD